MGRLKNTLIGSPGIRHILGSLATSVCFRAWTEKLFQSQHHTQRHYLSLFSPDLFTAVFFNKAAGNWVDHTLTHTHPERPQSNLDQCYEGS